MAGKSMSEAYDFDLFDTSKRNSSAAPVIEKPAKPRLVPTKPRTGKELDREAKIARINAVKIIAVTMVMVVLLGSLILCRVKITEYTYKAEHLQAQIDEAKSENVRLNNEVKSMYSIGNIAAYAEEKLGMIKRDSYQVNYFSVDGSIPAE